MMSSAAATPRFTLRHAAATLESRYDTPELLLYFAACRYAMPLVISPRCLRYTPTYVAAHCAFTVIRLRHLFEASSLMLR